MAVGSFDDLDEQLVKDLVAQGSFDFDTWTSVISSIEQLHNNDIDKIRLVYDSFLSEYPLCYGYWKRYAEHTARLCSVDSVVQIFERAVKLAPYCVGVWVNYCSFSMTSFEDPLDVCRLFERGLSFVGRDYLCYTLWDKYIDFGYSHESWNTLASIFIRTLKFPTKKLHQYYESFKKLVAIWKEDMEVQGSFQKEKEPEHDMDSEMVSLGDDELSHVVNGLTDPSTRTKALEKYISVGECYYQRACGLELKVKKFEQSIHRPYFHVKPLDDKQLDNWHQYLDLVETEGDFDWAVKLYERCLISCAHYPEFWMRYIDYVDSKGGREMAFDALERATNIFLKNAAEVHIFSAWFKEKIGDYDGVQAALVQCNYDFGPSFINTVRRKANIERRMGNYATASNIYKEALDLATEKRPDALPILYVHFARLEYIITNSVEATREVLLNAIKRLPYSKLLLKELIHFALMHDGARQVDLLDSIMGQALAPAANNSCSLSNEDREELSSLYLEFLDSCGSINDIRRQWKYHLNNFRQCVRVQSSCKKPAKSNVISELDIESRFNIPSTHPQNFMKDFDKNHMMLLSSAEKELVAVNNDKLGKATQIEDDSSNLNDMELVASEVKKTFVEDESKASMSGPDGGNTDEVVKGNKLCCIQEEEEHDRKSKQDKLDSLDANSLNPPERVYDQKSQDIPISSRNSPADGHGIGNNSSKLSPQDSKDAPCPTSRMRLKDLSSTLSPDRLLEKDRSQRQFNSSNSSSRGRSRLGSPGDSGERLERSLSPRRRNSHSYWDDRRHRERSLSPRRQNSRWHTEDRWHRDGRHRRFSRYQDNPRNFRDGRMQNQNKVGIGNKGAPQQQSTGSSSHAILISPQFNAYPQAQTSQYPLPTNYQFGNLQNSQLYSQTWQNYYYLQQQQQQPPLPQPSLGADPQQQLPLGVCPQSQLPLGGSPQPQMQTLQQLQQTPQLLQLTNQQQQLFYQQLQFQQTPNEQQQLQLQQMQLPQQQLYIQQQPQQEQQNDKQQLQTQQPQQTQSEKQDEVYLQQQQQQQQTYQYQQYLLYLQQLQQYQQLNQQSGIAPDQKLPEEQKKGLPDTQEDDGSGSAVAGSTSSPKKEDKGIDHIHGGTTVGVPTGDELPEIEGTDM